MKDASLNLLPDSEKSQADEALKKSSHGESGGVKLVIPKFSEEKKETKKQPSWLEKRKQKKEEKEAKKRRRRGETAIKQAVKTAKPEAKHDKKAKSGLFTDVPEKKSLPKKESIILKRKPEKKPTSKPPKPKKEKHKKKIKHVPPKRIIVAEKSESPTKLHRPKNGHNGVFRLGVNLVPEGVAGMGRKQPWILGTIVLLLVAAGWLVAAGVTVTHVNGVQAQVLEKNAELAKVKILTKDLTSIKQASELLQKQFGAVEGLLDGHIYWDVFFEQLEEKTIPDVYYVTLLVQGDGLIVLGGVAKTYEAAARQIRSFELSPNFVSSIEVSEARVEIQPDALLPVPIVAFDMIIELAPGVSHRVATVNE